MESLGDRRRPAGRGGRWALALGLLGASLARTASAAFLDPSFDAHVAVGGGPAQIMAVLVQPDGKILIGGNFTMVGGLGRVQLARLNADGTADPTFMSPFDDLAGGTGSVGSIARNAGGDLYVAGQIKVGGAYKNMVRLGPDGAVDPSFAIDASLRVSTITQLAAVADKVYVATVAGGRLARLTADGKLDPAFPAFSDTRDQATYLTFRIRSNGSFVLALDQNVVGLTGAGALDPGFVTYALGVPSTIDLLSNDQVVVFANLGLLTGMGSMKRFATLNSGGAMVGAFDVDASVRSFLGVLNDKLFIEKQGTPDELVQRLNLDGTVDGLSIEVAGMARVVAAYPGGRLLIAGDFDSVEKAPRPRIARVFATDQAGAAGTGGPAGSSGAAGAAGSSAPPGKGGGCAVGGHASSNGPGWVALAVLALVLARRRRHARQFRSTIAPSRST